MRWNRSSWSVIDSGIVEPYHVELFKWGFARLWTSPAGKMYSSYYGVYEWNGSSWDRMFDCDRPLEDVYGTSDKDIYSVGTFGSVFHFDGDRWSEIHELTDSTMLLTGVWTDGREVFIAWHTVGGARSVVFHASRTFR